MLFPVRRRAGAVLAVTALLWTGGLAACSDEAGPASNESADADGSGEVSPAEVLAFAKQQLDTTSGVRLALSTDDQPDTDAFLGAAEGAITDEPAFAGTAEGTFRGLSQSGIGVISVDGSFYVDLPVLGWEEFDPTELCAPDPALLLDPQTGVTTLLTAAQQPTAGESVRSGADNDQILTPYTATVPGEAMQGVLPCSPGESFESTFTIDSDGRMQGAEMTGEFFAGADDLTYTIEITEYDVTQEILAP